MSVDGGHIGRIADRADNADSVGNIGADGTEQMYQTTWKADEADDTVNEPFEIGFLRGFLRYQSVSKRECKSRGSIPMMCQW